MSLALRFTVTESDDRKSIRVKPTTGVYDALTNAGGWGTPNPAIGDALTATIAIALRKADGTYVSYTTQDAYPTLPNITETEFIITAEDAGFGVDSTFPDGIYRIIYTVTGDDGSPFDVNVTDYIVLQGDITCCYNKAVANVSTCLCNCDSLDKHIIELDFFFNQLTFAKEQMDLSVIDNYLKKISQLCSKSGCNC